MRRKRFHSDRTSAKPYGRYSSFCSKHNRSFPTYDFCRECDREKYLAEKDKPAPPIAEPSAAEKARMERIRALADAMAGGPKNG